MDSEDALELNFLAEEEVDLCAAGVIVQLVRDVGLEHVSLLEKGS